MRRFGLFTTFEDFLAPRNSPWTIDENAFGPTPVLPGIGTIIQPPGLVWYDWFSADYFEGTALAMTA
ncbi:hypothetical protein ACFORG_00670 [Lutimaribacter marinistellae]|uniref:Uncharacterized protein n=1 Tax=Lutimaribacter marinistellae TaxID=1820329 RepID=A0ABV7TBY9_9RHOB